MKRISVILALALICGMLIGTGAQAKPVPYTMFLEASVEIYDGPGYIYEYKQDVGKDNRYTIVEEQWDRFGNLWGRLKSGVGWVILLEYEPDFHFKELPYTTFLEAEDWIYDGPGYEYDWVKLVGKDNRYTIVEEAICEYGHLWGRLKSGAGWVRVPNIVSEESYTMELGAWVPIFQGPGYDYMYSDLVGKDNTYTIIMEIKDDEGNYWGRLKSGAGWVNLDYIREAQEAPIIASFADERLLDGGDYREYIENPSDYAECIAFRANERLKNVKFSELRYNGDTYEVEEQLYRFSSMYTDEAFVAAVAFYGDMTTFGISFTDASGVQRHYAVYISARNSSLVLEEYTP